MTSEALDGQLQSCYAARARPKCLTEEKCFRLRLNRARELQLSVFREFQTAGAKHRNMWSAKWVLVVGLCSSSVVEEWRWREDCTYRSIEFCIIHNTTIRLKNPGLFRKPNLVVWGVCCGFLDEHC